MERMQSTWENVVEMDLSESGVRPVSLRELGEMGLDLDAILDMPLSYSQSNGTIPLRESLAAIYPGATPDHIEVTNGTSEANYLLALALVREGDEVAFEVPNYMQYWGLPQSLGAKVNRFHLRIDQDWEPDWDEFDRAVNQQDAPGLHFQSQQSQRLGALARRHEAHRGALRGGRRVAAGRRSLSGRRDLLRAHAELLGHERPRHRHQRALQGLRHSRACASAGSSARRTWSPSAGRQHDYLTIGPNKISDAVARVAVRPENREKLYARTRAILQHNLPIMRQWVAGFGGFLTFREPQAGALCLMRYNSDAPSYPLCERIRVNQSVLIVPGVQLGWKASSASGWAASRSS